MTNIYGNNFYWWVGVVEDRFDPMYLGRCKVRIAGYHSSDTTELPTKDLPWAYPLQPITSAAMSGIGQTPVGPVEGTWVTGYFRDGEDCQEPIIIGTMGGIPGKGYFDSLRENSSHGFQDPNKQYPKDEYLSKSEPDTNRLARNQEIRNTIVQEKDNNRELGVPVAFNGESWNQPLTAYNAFYPYNHVFESESGHVVEIDDTKDNERIAIYHKEGTFLDIDANGTMVKKIVGDSYEIYARNNNVLIKGKANITIEGTCNIYVKNDCNLEVDGDIKAHAHGNLEMKAGKDLILSAKNNIKIHADEDINLSAEADINIKGENVVGGGTTTTRITSPLTVVKVVQGSSPGPILPIVPPSLIPIYGLAPIIPAVSTIDTVETQEPTFSELIVPTRREVLTFSLDVLGEDFETNAPVIKRLQEEAIADGIITREEVEAPAPSSEIQDATPTPQRNQRILSCGDFGNLSSYPETLSISKYFTIGSLTTKTACSQVKLSGFNGLGENEIACNIKALAENILDDIKQRYPNMFITSGFRNYVPPGGSRTSQHLKGQGADLQFRGASKAEYYNIARWIRDNVNFDQLLLEYQGGGNPWIHITFNKQGCRNTFGTFWNHRYATNGRERLIQLA